MKLKCLIIDDEPDAIRLMERLLTDFCADKTEIAGMARGSAEGMELIERTRPDLVFLDIEMPGASGFDLMDLQKNRRFSIVFVTAYDRHAVKAIRYKPDGYILKPISISELTQTVDRIYREKNEMSGAMQPNGRYSISLKDETVMVDFSDMLYIKADGRYSDVHLSGNRSIRVCKNIGSFEKELQSKGFVRCHKSYLVNRQHIVRLSRADGGYVEVSNGTIIEISRRKKNQLFRPA